ncbi:MAG: hypothetical protein GXO21_03875, partial [Aquificae bacterium]|nr:hypothetical protein [Aquificota bacterium]
ASKKLVEDLIRNGFPTKNKSLTAYVPKFEDKKLIQGFLLGIFDADGSAFTSEKGKTFYISVCGTLNICKEFARFFSYEEKYIKKIKNKNLYEFKVGRQKIIEVEKFYKRLYSQAPVFLERKKKVFEFFLCK